MRRVTNEVIVERIEGLKILTSEKFNGINKRLDKINGRLNSHSNELDEHNDMIIKDSERINNLQIDNCKARSGWGKFLMKVMGML